jgi:hypothetical protein
MSAVTFTWLPAVLAWPGIVVVDSVCARLGFYESGAPNPILWQAPGLLLDILMYTVVFWVFSLTWRTLRKRRRSL